MVRTDRKQRVVIFAGAGASKAINSEQFPATREFFDRLPSEVTNDTYFQFVISYLKTTNPNAIIDIEMVLWELQNLYDFFKTAQDQKNIVGRAINDNLIHHIQTGWTFGQLSSATGRMMSLLRSTIDQINEQVFDIRDRIDRLARRASAVFRTSPY